MKLLEILFEDQYLVLVNKHPGIPSQADKTGHRSILQMAEKRFGHPMHIINRLDRPASGILLLAKKKKAAALLNKWVAEKKLKKTYLAAVQHKPEQDEATLNHFLIKKNGKAFITSDSNKGKEAILHYRVVQQTDHYHLLAVELITGRFHQIRAQLAHMGCPIKGDVKYGARRANKDRSIHLHAWKLSFIHPFTRDHIEVKAPLPDDPVWNCFEKM